MDDLIEQLEEMLDVCEEQSDPASVRVGIVGRKILAIIRLLIEEMESA